MRATRSSDDMDLPTLTPWRDAGFARRCLEYNIFTYNSIRLAKLCEEALKDNSEKSTYFFALAAATHYKSGVYVRAAEFYDKLFELGSNQAASTYSNAAYSHFDSCHYVRAAELYNKALQVDSGTNEDKSRDMYFAAHSHFMNDSYGAAATLFDKVLELDPDQTAMTYYNAAHSHFMNDSYGAAAKLYGLAATLFDKILELDPDQAATVYSNAAYSHFMNDSYGAAAKLFDKVLELDPDQTALTYFNAAYSHFMNDSYDAAAKLYDKVLELDSNQADTTYSNAAYSHYNNNSYDRAAKLYDKVLELDSNQTATTYFNAAYSHFMNDSYVAAAKLYDKLLELDADQDASTYSYAIDSHIKAGNEDRAKEISSEARRRSHVAALDAGIVLRSQKKRSKKETKQKSSSKKKGKEAIHSAKKVTFKKEFDSAVGKATLMAGNYQQAEEGIQALVELMERPSLREDQRNKVRQSWLQACKELCTYYKSTHKPDAIIKLFEGREEYLEGNGVLEEHLKRLLIISKDKRERSKTLGAKSSKKSKEKFPTGNRHAPQFKKPTNPHAVKRNRVNSSSSSGEDKDTPLSHEGSLSRTQKTLIRQDSRKEVSAAVDGETLDEKKVLERLIQRHGSAAKEYVHNRVDRAIAELKPFLGLKKKTTGASRNSSDSPFTVELSNGEVIRDVKDMQHIANEGLKPHHSSKLKIILARLESGSPHSPDTWKDGDYNFNKLTGYNDVYYVRINIKHRVFFQVDTKSHKVILHQVGGHDFTK